MKFKVGDIAVVSVSCEIKGAKVQILKVFNESSFVKVKLLQKVHTRWMEYPIGFEWEDDANKFKKIGNDLEEFE